MLDNADLYTRRDLAVPGGIRLVYLRSYSPQLQVAETLWTLVDGSIVNKPVPTLDAFVDTIGARYCDLTRRQTEIACAPASLGGLKTVPRSDLAKTKPV